MKVEKLFDVKDKVVLVSGGGRGIGEMIATGYVMNGAKVYISSRSAKACEETASRLSKIGPGKCIAIPGDLSKYEEVVRVAKRLSDMEEVLNVLVNNSGANWGAPLEEYPDDAFTKVMNLNVQRVFTLTQKLVPLLRKGAERDGCARVINIGSVQGTDPPVLETYAYSASKAALAQLSRVLASRLGSEGITVNTLACGPFQSRMMKETLKNFEKEIVAGVPLGRIGSPEDVAGACLFLSSRAGQWVTGANIALDGGSMIRAKL